MDRNALKRNAVEKIALISMIRNESDIITSFLAYALELFDDIYIVNVSSTDGTTEILDLFSKTNKNIHIFTTNIKEKYQAAYINQLSRLAFSDGADWIFLLDGDEFLNIDNRDNLIAFLNGYDDNFMVLPWINLIPTSLGSFTKFNINQIFYWTGRTSRYCKVAINRFIYETFPNYYIDEGSHNLYIDNSPCISNSIGLTILHLPIRSHDRLKYKIQEAYSTLQSKAGKLSGEGSHVECLYGCFFSGAIAVNSIQYLAAHYAEWDIDLFKSGEFKINKRLWPSLTFHPIILNEQLDFEGVFNQVQTVEQVFELDQKFCWKKIEIYGDQKVMAKISLNKINIIPQPTSGMGNKRTEVFKSLNEGRSNAVVDLDAVGLSRLIHSSFMKVEALTFSAWSELTPVLFALFQVLKPRRYVELGTHHGMSFYAACQAKQSFGIAGECIAIDTWAGDKHAGFYSGKVFDDFLNYLSATYPDEYYIRSKFENALECFEDKSIDLLHIDGLHTYEAVKNDFDMWLPKMSNSGVMMFHDTNAYKLGFGVWKFWSEISKNYPSFEFKHSHGLGILYVGTENNCLNNTLEKLNQSNYQLLAQTFFESVGVLSICYTTAYISNYNLSHDRPIVDNTAPMASSLHLLKNIARKVLPRNMYAKLAQFYKSIR